MGKLLPAKATAPNSQCVNYRKASGIQIYAKLKKPYRLMPNTAWQKRPLLTGSCKPQLLH